MLVNSDLQAIFLDILGDFLNGESFSYSSYLFPLYKNEADIIGSRTALDSVENRRIQNAIDAVREGETTEKDLARFLTAFYEETEVDTGSARKKVVMDSFSDVSEEYDPYHRRILDGLGAFFDDEPAHILVHGSFGDREYVRGYSDLDTVIVLEESALSSATDLVRLRRSIIQSRYYQYRIDALQHHGHVIFTERDFQNYPRSRLPIIVYERSGVSLSGDTVLRARYDKDSIDYRGKFIRTAESLSRRLDSAPRDLYDQKVTLSLFMLLPTLFLQVVDGPVYKEESFTLIERYFDTELLSPLRRASQIRREWPKLTIPPISPQLYYYLFPGYPRTFRKLRSRITGRRSFDFDRATAVELVEAMVEEVSE